ncbi:TlpA family protein disulfide reductase [Legionella feeleii]|uniref:Thiol-disulfide oxidoreductase n=1 Tax=Legionella feeleii TaxID=453 RepID=A0A0W0TN06_9GAMM|nr:thiol-disulfide oxidoreductase [Legionella feeleii]SPX60839.1 thiol-disulfide oxidoreductase [Legionella feeleii]
MFRLKLVFAIVVYFGIVLLGHASEIVLKDVNGKHISFSSLKGKWIFINYWASWCNPCLDEIAEFNRFYRNKKDKVALFAVNYDMLPVEKQLDLIRQYNIRYPSLQHNPARELHLGNIRGVPVTFVFNPQGELSQTLYGGQTLASLNRVIKNS